MMGIGVRSCNSTLRFIQEPRDSTYTRVVQSYMISHLLQRVTMSTYCLMNARISCRSAFPDILEEILEGGLYKGSLDTRCLL